MKTEKTDDNTAAVQEPKTVKTVRVSLTGSGVRLTILASRKRDDSGVTIVTTTDGKKKPLRGMTSKYTTFDLAVAALRKLEKDAIAKGWKKSERSGGFKSKPDAFTVMPAAPKAGGK
jgi:hypothetical protein